MSARAFVLGVLPPMTWVTSPVTSSRGRPTSATAAAIASPLRGTPVGRVIGCLAATASSAASLGDRRDTDGEVSGFLQYINAGVCPPRGLQCYFGFSRRLRAYRPAGPRSSARRAAGRFRPDPLRPDPSRRKTVTSRQGRAEAHLPRPAPDMSLVPPGQIGSLAFVPLRSSVTFDTARMDT